jgi:hypothetical protein
VNPSPQLSIGDVFGSMRGAFEEHRPLLVRGTLVFAVLSALTTSVELAGTPGAAISIGIQIFLNAAYIGGVAILVCRPEAIEGVGDLWSRTRPVLARLIWMQLLVLVAVVAGLLLFVIPGLILLTIWAVASQVVAVESAGVLAGLSRSRELVRRNGWRVFAFITLLALLSAVVLLLVVLITLPLGTGAFAGALSVFLISMTVAPISAIGPAALYGHLTGTAPSGIQS